MKPGIKFGISAVQSGQKGNANVYPRLYANSSNGQFKVTGLVTKALGVKVGDNIMFLNNIDAIEKAIQDKDPQIVDYANEKGIDLDDRSAALELVKELTQWYIAAGIVLRKKNGEPMEATIRVTKEEKEKMIADKGVALIEAMSDDVRIALAEKKGVDADDFEALAESLTAEDIESPKTVAMSGSKTASTSTATGTGVQVNFTDSNIWNQLKIDLGDNKDKFVRVFDVDIENPEDAVFNDGCEDIAIKAYPINYVEDKEPIRRNGQAEE